MYTAAAAPLAALLLATTTYAISVSSPSSSTVWSSSTAGQSITWQAVSTDATSFVVQLVNQAGFLTDSPVTLIANQSTGSPNVENSATVTYPSGTWPAGTAFQINLVTSTGQNSAILAQSPQFNITNSGSVVASSSSASSSSSSSSISSSSSMSSMMSSSSSVTASVTITTTSGTSASVTTSTAGSGGDASGGIPNSSVTSKSASETTITPSALMSVLLGVAGLMGVYL